jgi:phage-related minor tail protein
MEKRRRHPMANNIKGLTIEFGGDTTKLGKALEDVNKKSTNLSGELREVNRLLKMDPGNADLLAQKQEILGKAVENTAKKLDTLKEAERQVQAQFERGEVSEEQVRALKREIEATEQKLNGYKNAVRETADEVENLGKRSQASADELNDFANLGLATVGGLVTAAGGALVAAAESTREYRTEMGKLETAFDANGHSAETATATYKALQGVIGETDQTVEAAQQIALLAQSEQDAAHWAELAGGVVGRFGDALQPETFYEAANETFSLNEATGAYVQLIEGVGGSVEEFNKGLQACTTDAEKQAYMLEYTQSVLGGAAEAYKETNADVIAANQANEAWMASLAQVGAAVEPVVTDVKTIGAELLGKLVPAITAILNNLPAVGVALAGITAALVSYKVAAIAATAAEKGMTLAQYAAAAAQKVLNTALLSNPIGIVILAITALVTAFMVLWKNSSSFRNFWINLWEKIKSTALKAADALKTLPTKIYNSIKAAITKVQTWGTDLVNRVKTAASNMLTNAANTLAAMPGRVYSAISGAIQRVVSWGSQMLSKAKTAAKNVVSGVFNTLKELPGKVLSIGGDLVAGLWNGISNKVAWLKSKIKGFASSVLDSIKGFFGVASPSKETAYIGDMLDQGLAKGVLDNASDPVKAMQRVSGSVLDAATRPVDGLSLTRTLSRPVAAPAAAAGMESGLGAKLDRILEAIERGQVLMIDGDALVGATANKMDNRLGQRRVLAARGAV